MTPQELKNSILQLAIQGKLVEQRPEEGIAEELYQQIQAEKQQLIKAGIIKKENPLPEITEDEKPFDIPDSWMFVRLDDIVAKNIKRGKSPTYIDSGNTLVFAQKCNVKTGGINMALAQYLDESTLHKYPDEEFLRHMDIIANSTGNGTLGRIGIFRDSDNPTNQKIVSDSHVTVIRVSNCILPEYAYYFLRSRQPYLENMGDGSTNQTELKPYVLRALIIPLPPLAEQKRIAAKIEELLPYIHRYEQAWSKLEDFNKRFPGDMQKSILQMAIQGKLVEQRPEDGTGEELYQQIQSEKQKLIKSGTIKKDKPLPEITEDEKPFDIPGSWKWVHLDNIAVSGLGKTLDKAKNTGGFKPYLCSINVYWSGIDLSKVKEARFEQEELPKYKLEKGDLLICEGGDVGRSAIWDSDDTMYYQNALHRVRFHGGIDAHFYKYLLECYKGMGIIDAYSKGMTIKHLVQSALNDMWLPLPPLAEQKRIVTKLEEVLPLCEKLKK